jgi:thioredoxin 1
MVELTSGNWDSVVAGNRLVLVDFWAPWCGPCKAFGPVLEQASELHRDIIFGKVNIDDQKQLAERFGVQAIPTLKLISDRTIRGTRAGAMSGPALEQLISRFREVAGEDG